jgi:tetratricopeptide (TPR) repeat protein
MGKLVVLRLDGNFETLGFRVTLTIAQEGALPEVELTGYLPNSPELAAHLQHHWQENYRRLGAPSRIKPKKINYGGSVNDLIQECAESAKELRVRLISWLDSESFRAIDRRLREELNRDDAIRFLIRTEDKELQKLPWQAWDFFERYPKAEVALSATKFERIKTSTLITPKAKVRILAILGHSEGINIEADRQLLENLPDAEITFLVEKTRQEINDQLWEQAWDIIFFAGHSETEGETGRIYINPTESLTIDELEYALKKVVEGGLKIAIFNSCDGLGLARQLEDLQIPQVIVMRELVPDRVAQEFLKHFLTAFVGGQFLHLAVREARERLQGLESEFPCASWLPMICQNLVAVPQTWKEFGGISHPIYEPKSASRFWLSSIKSWSKLTLILFLGCIVSYPFAGPQIAPFVNEVGRKNYDKGQLLRSQFYYHIATLLDSNYALPHYNLGWLCDKNLNDMKCALQEYQRAALRGLPEGHAQVARLEILKNNHQAALTAIYQCLKHTSYDAVKAACLKNRGWMLLKENRLTEAEKDLRRAIALEENSPHSHCLLAQVLEAQGRQQEASVAWKNTEKYSRYNVPEQYECIGWTKQR